MTYALVFIIFGHFFVIDHSLTVDDCRAEMELIGGQCMEESK